MSVIRVAHRYAKSLVQLAKENESLESIHEEVLSIHELIDTSDDLKFLLRSPIIKQQKKQKIIQQVFKGNVSDTLMNFLNIVLAKGREGILPEILDAFVTEYNNIKGITPVIMTTAVPVDEEFGASVINILQKEFGLSQVELTQEVDEKLIGGLVLEFDHKRYDASVSHQLDRLRHTLLNAE